MVEKEEKCPCFLAHTDSCKLSELEKKIGDINKTIDNRDIIPKGWAKSIDGYSKLKKQIDVLKLNQMDGTPNQNFVAIHILKNGLTQIGLKWDNWTNKIEDMLRDSFTNKKENAEKHLAELVDDPQIEARFIKACEKQIEDAKRQLEKLDSLKKEESKNSYLDLGMITSKDGELSDYNPSQFVRDYAKTHTLFSLYGLVLPEEDSGSEKEEDSHSKERVDGDVSARGNNPASNSNLPEHVKDCTTCGFAIDHHPSTYFGFPIECTNSGEGKELDYWCTSWKPKEKTPEPIDPCISCSDKDICINECEISKEAKGRKEDFEKETETLGDLFTPMDKSEPEKDPCGIEGKYEHWNREELENECNVLVQNIDALYVLHAKEKQERIEAFKDKLEFLRDKVLEAPILSGSVQDLRDYIHDLKDLVIKNINEYDGVLKT